MTSVNSARTLALVRKRLSRADLTEAHVQNVLVHGSDALGGVEGLTDRGLARSAQLFIGRSVRQMTAKGLIGKTAGGETIGSALTREEKRAEDVSHVAAWGVVFGLRAAQVGFVNAYVTVSRAQGVYQRVPEATVAVLIIFRPSDGERTWTKFRANVLDLSERAASRLAQEEILVLLSDGRTTRQIGASPKGLKAPG